MAEWSIAAVLKTVEGNTSGGSNPSLSANQKAAHYVPPFFIRESRRQLADERQEADEKRGHCEAMDF